MSKCKYKIGDKFVVEISEIYGERDDIAYRIDDCLFNEDDLNKKPKLDMTAEEAWEKSKEIKVGDVVTNVDENYVVTGIEDGTWYVIMNERGYATSVKGNALEKTGRHIDIQSLLEQIGGKE